MLIPHFGSMALALVGLGVVALAIGGRGFEHSFRQMGLNNHKFEWFRDRNSKPYSKGHGLGSLLAIGSNLGHRGSQRSTRTHPVSVKKERPRGARWAHYRDLDVLFRGREDTGRLVLGTLAVRNGAKYRRKRLFFPRNSPRVCSKAPLLMGEPGQSLAVIGPTQSGKTASLAIPAILGWEGPILATSVKADLLNTTISWRRECGRVWCFDPMESTSLPSDQWSPLTASRTWPGARKSAGDLVELARSEGTTADGDFWYSTALKLLAPLLFAAAIGGLSMSDVVRWVDTQEVDEVLDILQDAGDQGAIQAARASWQREERQRSSVYTTAETVLEPFVDLVARGTSSRDLSSDYTRALTPGLDYSHCADIDPSELIKGSNSLYVCAPAHDQRRLRPLFVVLVKQTLEAAFALSTKLNAPLNPPLLVVLDEAANIAPLADLDAWAATCAGHGVQLVTVWQDLAQITARYGAKGQTVINNHRAKLFLSGIGDPSTLDHASHLVGDEELLIPTVTRDGAGARSTTATPTQRRLLPPDALRCQQSGTGILVYGALPPVKLVLRPWWEDPELSIRAGLSLTSIPSRNRKIKHP